MYIVETKVEKIDYKTKVGITYWSARDPPLSTGIHVPTYSYRELLLLYTLAVAL